MKSKVKNYDVMLAGTQYNDDFGNSKYENSEGSREGSLLSLMIEEDNPVDPLAVVVTFQDKNIGYIPKSTNLELAYYLSFPDQFELECRLKKRLDNDDYYEMIVVVVKVYSKVQYPTIFSYEVFDEQFPDYDKRVMERLQKTKNKEIEIEEKTKIIEPALKESKPKNKLLGCFKFVVIGLGILFLLFILIIVLVAIFGS